MRNFSAKPLVLSGVFLALTILFTYVFSIQTPFLRISFGFLPIAVYATMFGPLRAACLAAVADLLGSMLFFAGLFFPGFTLSAFISGFIYGYFFHRKQLTIKQICIPFILIFLFVDLGLNTLWLTMLYHKAASLFLLSRLAKAALFLPMQIFLFSMVYKPLSVFLPKPHILK